LLGAYEGLRGADLLPDGERRADRRAGGRRCRAHPRRRAVAGAAAAEELPRRRTCSRGPLDQDLQQVDLRDRNSWRLLLAEVPSVELLEVQLVNAVAPFVLNARLKPLMLRTPERDKHIVNVSAVEGQFYRKFKTTRHPHTNMAKAALNMMTRTAAADYHADGIHMNSVDTGWVTDEDPVQIAARKHREHGSTRRSTSSTARRASSIRSSTASTPASTCGASSSRTTAHRLVALATLPSQACSWKPPSSCIALLSKRIVRE
jgi:hypothetical protein